MTRTSPARRRASTRGFSTVEVLVALGIVLLVGTIALTSIGGLERARLRHDTAEIALILNQARLQALEHGQTVDISWSERAGELRVGRQIHVLHAGTEAEVQPTLTRIRPSGESSGLRVTLTRGAFQSVIELDWLTGRVEVRS